MLATKFKASSNHAPTIAVDDKLSGKHVLRYALVVVGCSLAPTPVRAEMLLAEISFTTSAVVAPAPFVFGVSNRFAGSPPHRNWIETVASFPYTSLADAATLAEFDRLLPFQVAMDDVGFGLNNGPYEMPRPSPTSQFWLELAFEGAYNDIGVIATRYVEPVGVSYTLTAIERNVTPTIQTIQIFGNPDPPPDIPEPATAVLVLCAALLYVSRCWPCSIGGRRRRTCRRP